MSVVCLRMCQVCAVGFLAAMMWLLCVIAVVRNIRTLDQMGKRIHLQAASIAFVATVILNYVFFGLETARICSNPDCDMGIGTDKSASVYRR